MNWRSCASNGRPLTPVDGFPPVRGVPPRGRAGFTLLELMIVVAVVAILAAIALPSYQNSLRKGNRAEAKAILMETAQYMERYFTTNNAYYVSASPPTVISSVSPKGATGGDVKYNISFNPNPPTATAFTVQAVPANSQVGDSCGTLTLANTGAQTPDASGCW